MLNKMKSAENKGKYFFLLSRKERTLFLLSNKSLLQINILTYCNKDIPNVYSKKE